MKLSAYIFVGLSAVVTAQQDTFNYRGTSGRDYGPADWDSVSCNNLDTCPGWPAKLQGSIGWAPSNNQCEWCPITGNSCGQHRQSPIDLNRDRAIPGDPNEKECPDWHWIQYLDGTCNWDDMQGQFEIGRNALMVHTPLRDNGDIDCVNEDGERKFPKLDYSKGFPDWWYLSRTDITVPSEHVQHGQRYAAEIKLSHFYEIGHYKNKLGLISIFMQDFENEPSWPFLDKLICKWRREEEEKRRSCGLPPAPVYQMCELYRGQVRTEDDVTAPREAIVVPTRAPLVAPPAEPIQNYGGDPEEFRLPLALCQGDCDFATECAPGLICHRRDAFDAVPGCIGGESDFTNTDYCVFDPYGEGYTVPTAVPTGSPTITERPTITPLEPQGLTDFGGTPPADKFPLQICQGDCDKDEDCAIGLICFQRGSNETVPGCIGGGTDIQKTDYCIQDPYGQGYELPAMFVPVNSATTADPSPSPAPSVTPSASPTAGPSPVPTQMPSVPPTEVPRPTTSPSFYPRPVGEPLELQNLGWEPPVPLGECQGDCDEDIDCAPGLHCYQRDHAFEDVPGCAGGDEESSLADFCAYRPLPTEVPDRAEPANPTNTPTASPTGTRSASPTSHPTVSPAPTKFVGDWPNATNIGWSPENPLALCMGDCDSNDDCMEGLICYQRNNANEEIPGCLNGALDGTLADYCIKDPDFLEGRVETRPPTNAPVTASVAPSTLPTVSPTSSPTSSPSSAQLPIEAKPLIKDLGWTPPPETKPLKLCEGDCDIDQDCGPDLKCYQRYLPNLAVPGCSGGEDNSDLTDYCVTTELWEAATMVSPTNPPVESRVTSPAPGLGLDFPTVPPSLSCAKYADVNFFRMCKVESCCFNPRSSSEFCHESYVALGDDVESACHHCCLEQQGEALEVGPPAVEHPEILNNFDCSSISQPNRMCREDSCCEADGSHTQYCQTQYSLYTLEQMNSICWYCCFPSKIFGDDTTRRELAEEEEDAPLTFKSSAKSATKTATATANTMVQRSKAALKQYYKNQTHPVGEKDRVTHDVNGKTIIVREENFEEKGMIDEEAYFDEMFSSYQRRALQFSQAENYDDVEYWPYEWLLKVGTEYYFRYEGTQTVPPCYDTAHWRVFKDPIRVAPHQMRELERLIAWRRGDNCRVDTAGANTGNPDKVDVARPLQSYHRLHRKVFCECKDWPSKFIADRQWCRNWQTKPPEQRLKENPYNFPSNGFDLL